MLPSPPLALNFTVYVLALKLPVMVTSLSGMVNLPFLAVAPSTVQPLKV